MDSKWFSSNIFQCPNQAEKHHFDRKEKKKAKKKCFAISNYFVPVGVKVFFSFVWKRASRVLELTAWIKMCVCTKRAKRQLNEMTTHDRHEFKCRNNCIFVELTDAFFSSSSPWLSCCVHKRPQPFHLHVLRPNAMSDVEHWKTGFPLFVFHCLWTRTKWEKVTPINRN